MPALAVTVLAALPLPLSASSALAAGLVVAAMGLVAVGSIVRWLRDVAPRGIGSNRRSGLIRVVGTIAYLVVILLVGWLIAIVYLLTMLYDLAVQITLNRPGIDDDSSVVRLFRAHESMKEYLLYGSDDPPKWTRSR